LQARSTKLREDIVIQLRRQQKTSTSMEVFCCLRERDLLEVSEPAPGGYENLIAQALPFIKHLI